VLQQRPARERLQHLRLRGTHPSALARGQDDDTYLQVRPASRNLTVYGLLE
jgi:hypothetical protein